MSRKTMKKESGLKWVKENEIFQISLTHLCPASSIEYECCTIDQNFNFNLRRDPQKISYERRAYESVDEKSLS